MKIEKSTCTMVETHFTQDEVVHLIKREFGRILASQGINPPPPDHMMKVEFSDDLKHGRAWVITKETK